MEGIFVVVETSKTNPRYYRVIPFFERDYRVKSMRIKCARELLEALIIFQREEYEEHLKQLSNWQKRIGKIQKKVEEIKYYDYINNINE